MVSIRRIASRTVIAVTIVAFAAGYGQFGAVAALGEVARTFGDHVSGSSVADQAGLSATVLGAGLAVLRLASLFGLPLAALGDRWGRTVAMVAWCIVGLAATMSAAASPSYWWFVLLFAIGRPFLSATAALSQVVVAELSRPEGRAAALAVVSAGYGLGAGANGLIHTISRGSLGFRGLFLTSVVPLLIVVVVARRIPEPAQLSSAGGVIKPRLGSVGADNRRRLATVIGLIGVSSALSAPASSFVFLYAENVTHLSKGIESIMLVLAAGTGLAGLLLGRRAADRQGRRPAIAIGVVGLALASVVLYSGGRVAVVVGYLAVVLSTGYIAPAGTAFPNELFPTAVRASVAGWGIVASVLGAVVGLLVFGAVVGSSGSYLLAAVVTSSPVVVSLALVARLPETRGQWLEGTLGSSGGTEPKGL